MIIRSPKDLALFVQDQRKLRKVSQVEVSGLARVKQSTVSALENKPEGTKLETLFRVLTVMNLELEVNFKDEKLFAKRKALWNEEW